MFNRVQQQQQQQREPVLTPYLNDQQTGQTVVWVDDTNRFWSFDELGNPFEVDQDGYPLAPLPPQTVPRMPSSMGSRNNPIATSGGNNGGRRYGGRTPSITQVREETRNTTMGRNSYNRNMVDKPSVGDVVEVPEPVEAKMFKLSKAGYKPLDGSEFIPFYDESKSVPYLVLDEDNKTFNIIIKDK